MSLIESIRHSVDAQPSSAALTNRPSQTLALVHDVARTWYRINVTATAAGAARGQGRRYEAALERVQWMLAACAERLDSLAQGQPTLGFRPADEPIDHPWAMSDTGQVIYQTPSQALETVAELAFQHLVRPNRKLNDAERERIRSALHCIEGLHEDWAPQIDNHLAALRTDDTNVAA